MGFGFDSQWITNDFKRDKFIYGLRKGLVLFNDSTPINITESRLNTDVEYPNQFGLVFLGLISVLLISNKLRTINIEFFKSENFPIESIKHFVSAFLYFTIFLIIFPLLVLILSLFLIFRLVAVCILRLKAQDKFVELMEGTDCIWAYEDKCCLCIITGLGILEVPESETAFEVYHKIKERVYNRLFSQPIQCPKLFYQRQSFLGYFYWEYPESIHVEDYVRQVPNLGKTKHITKDTLDEYISKLSNAPLYKNHTKSWEILVGKQSIENAKTGVRHYPIIFRVHHTLGDGYALVQLLLEAISEKSLQNAELLKKYTDYKVAKDCLAEKSSNFERFMQLFYIPKLLFSQVIRKPDANILHNNQLSGEKITTWWSDNADGKMLELVKRVKGNYGNVRFCDVILSAIATSFSKFFEQNSETLPKTLTMVIPVRAEMGNLRSNRIIELTNRFTVGFVDLPINNNCTSLQQLHRVHNQTEKLRNSMEYAVNYWLIKILSSILPSQILSVLLYSEHATAIASNIPGPGKIILSDDMCLDDLIFWIPNRGRSGVGISILTYANRLQLGISIDKVFISSRAEVKTILTDIVHEIELFGVANPPPPTGKTTQNMNVKSQVY